jgi:small subunit ribosomal protein S6
MTKPAPTYDLVLLLDPQAEDGVRAKIVADTSAAVEGGGELLRHDVWGERPLAYPLAKKTSAEYHLFQFHAASTELLDHLDRTLRITDGVMRFRLIKLRSGVPEAPDMRHGTPPARRSEPEPAAEASSEVAAEAELALAEPS